MDRPRTALDAYRQALDLLVEADRIMDTMMTGNQVTIPRPDGNRQGLDYEHGEALARHKRETAASLIELAKLWHGASSMVDPVDEMYQRALRRGEFAAADAGPADR
jgi:uncharacterized protein YbaP (TraB family)